MIPVDELVYEFKLMINKVNRQDNVDIPIEDIILYLNRAQITWIKSKINPNNVYKVGYEAIRKRIDDLQILKKSNIRLRPQKTNDARFIGFECPLDEAENYMFYVSSYCIAKKAKCKKTISVDLIRQGELETRYYDVNFSPSFEWRSALATLGDNKLYVYTGEEFGIESVFITYLRYPNQIDIQGYIKMDETDSTNVNCELPYYAKTDIVDLAVKFAAQSNDNQIQAAFADNRLTKDSE